MIVAIHQPNYIPWIGYFDKLNKADKFVILDDAALTKANYITRNTIKTANGPLLLSVPVRSHTCLIKECELANNKWKHQHFKSIKINYSKSKYFKDYEEELMQIYKKTDYKLLFELNFRIIKWMMEKFKINTSITIASTLNINLTRNERNVELCKKMGATIYLSGRGGAAEYNDEEMYEKNNIKLVYQDFKHPIYPQLYGNFIPNLSALDFLFNVGEDRAANFFRENKKQKRIG